MKRSWLLSMVGLFFLIPSLNASLIHVPGDYATIQAGIDASVNGDTVLVAPGTYNENIDYNDRSITVMSANGPATTTIHGGLSGPVVSIVSGETAELEGFTIRGGNTSYIGAGVMCTNSSASIHGNIVTQNAAVSGGGIGVLNGDSVRIFDNLIMNNTGTAMGGGIYCSYGTNAEIYDNEIRNNHTGISGGGIFIEYGTGSSVHHNLVVYNKANAHAGGVLFKDTGYLVNNTIAFDTSTVSSGGGVVFENINAYAKNNIISNNTGYGILGINSNPVLTYNDVWGNPAGGYYSATPGVGSIAVDPQFIGGAPYDFHLTPPSPCIDAGDPASPLDPDGSPADMGAFYGGSIATYGSIDGTVTDSAGAPIAGAVVNIAGLAACDTTNAAGWFLIGPIRAERTYDLLFTHYDYFDTALADVYVAVDETTTADVTMRRTPPRGAIAGIVTDSSLTPIMGVSVAINSLGINDWTDNQGRYFIGDLRPQSYTISFSRSGYCDTMVQNLAVPPADTVDLDMVLMRSYDVYWMGFGNRNGGPIPAYIGEWLEVPVWGSTPTGDDADTIGFMHIPLSTDDDVIVSRNGGYLPDNFLGRWQETQFYPPDLNQPEAGWTNQSLLGFYCLSEPCDHQVAFWTGGNRALITTFVMRIANDPTLIGDTLSPLREGYQPQNGGPLWGDINGVHPYVPVASYPSVYFLEPQYGSLLGHVTDTFSNPIAGAQLRVIGAYRMDTTDAAGNFGFPSIPGGRSYDIILTHDAFPDTILAGIAITPGETTSVSVVLGQWTPRGAVTGTVTDAAAAPIAGVRVAINSLGISDSTDSQGRYFLGGIEPQAYDISFTHALYADEVAENYSVPSEDTATLNVTLQRLSENYWMRFGRSDGGLVPALIGARLEVPVWGGTPAGVYDDTIAYMHIPLATLNNIVVARDGGYVPDTLLGRWDDVSFLSANLDQPAPGWTNQSLLAFHDIAPPVNPEAAFFTDGEAALICTFVMHVADDPSLAGEILFPFRMGYNPIAGGPEWGNQNGEEVYIPLCGFSGLYFLSPADVGYVRGRVTDDSALPIEGVRVSVIAVPGNDTTDAAGDYLLGWLAPGAYDVRFFKAAVVDTVVTGVVVNSSDTTILNLHLGGGPIGCTYIPGDINGIGGANGIDVVYGVNYLKGGEPPVTDCYPPCLTYTNPNPPYQQLPLPDPFYAAMDVNGSCAASGIDITYFVAFLRGIQPELKWCLDCPPVTRAVAAAPAGSPKMPPSPNPAP